MNKEFKVRDTRKKEQYPIDDAYLNGYAKMCGVYATAVYNSLSRHADFHTQECFPSIKKISEQHGIDPKTVIKAIAVLEAWNIIRKIKEKDVSTKRQKNNVYILLDKSEWKEKPRVDEIHTDSRVDDILKPSGFQVESRVDETDCKDTHVKDTHIKDSNAGVAGGEISKIIDAFKEINPSYKKWFGNTTQRSAAARLIETHGLELVLKYIEALKYTNAQPYAPTVTTPLQLEDKLADLKAWSDKAKNKSENTKYKPIKIIEV